MCELDFHRLHPSMFYYRLFQLALLVLLELSRGSDGNVDYCGSPGWPVPSPPQGLTLKQVSAVIRHGDRVVWNGSKCWPGDDSVWSCDLSKLELPSYWPSQYRESPIPRLYQKVYLGTDEALHSNCSVAQLTTKGYSQHLANGKALHGAYVSTGFLGGSPDPSKVYLRSDDIPRTLQSAEALVLGMFPPSDRKGAGQATPILPIFTRDATYDYMSPNAVLCPKVGVYAQKFRESKTWRDHTPLTQKLFKKIGDTTGINMTEDAFLHFCDCLCTHHCHNLSMPKGMTEELFNDVWAESTWQFYSLFKYPSVEESARVSGGFLLKDIWTSLNNSVNGSPVHKFLLYSGHDTTIMPLLVALRIDEGVWPPYASMLLIELYQNSRDNKHFVRIVYNGKVLSPPFCKDGLCDYETFSGYLATVTPPNNYKDTVCKV